MTATVSPLSVRGRSAAAETANLLVIWEMMANVWHPVTNPDGFINLGVAENTLMHTELLDYIHTQFRMSANHLTYGDGPSGSVALRAAIGAFVTKWFGARNPVTPAQVLVVNGCSSAIEASLWALADPGDAMLLGMPFYTAFPSDVKARAKIETVRVAFGNVDPFGIEAVAVYERELLAAQAAGQRVRALMLCSPHNPLGGCYSKEVLVALMRFCQKYQIHLISDEIYALSVFDNQETGEQGEFTSVLAIDTTGIIDAHLVHVLWSMSKDFCANGLRLGCIISQDNPEMLSAVFANGVFSYPAAPADVIAHSILSNAAFVESFVKTNQMRISDHHKFVTDYLRKHNIPYYKHTKAAFFIWMDLLTPLSLGTEAAAEISKEITTKLRANKLFIATGESFGTEEPGWFRIVFTQPQDLLQLALDRLVQSLGLEAGG